MPQLELDHILKQLKKHPLIAPKHCDNCGSAHVSEDFSLVSSDRRNVIFQSSCKQCSLVQVLRLSPGGPMSIQRFESNNSDVTGKEFQKFAGKPAVVKEEALEVYQQMRQVNGLSDFLGLLE